MIEPTTRPALGFVQLAAELDLARWQLRLARERGLVPPPDLEGGRWSAAAVAEVTGRAAQIRAALGEDPPVGAVKAAERLAVRVGLDVEPADIEVLVISGELVMADRFQGRPLYDPHDIDALDAGRVTEIVAARKGPRFETVNARGAALLLGWPKDVFSRIAGRRGLPTDQLGRYALADVRALADDQDLLADIAEERRIAALETGRRDQARAEQVIRRWLRDCTDYLTHAADDPPDTAEISRALKALATARTTLRPHHPDEPE
ncbi:hypothetical protein SAMN04489712_113158 [Thermomonospora echinospora]|uniref:Uncharacterized protein n=1 Tax=Thermomonospora echinospora TaxID=1992 RepID=A0A1H6D6X8_9ACTN|nr:hypothetical protein [Thermomonospora echinospora]SEG80824.1 hypothetical protein SAMN04489712_113158 [Thermomonospora echinospora]